MNRKKYAAPPITEAVVEIRLADELSDDNQGKIVKKLTPYYPVKQEMRGKAAHINVEQESVAFEAADHLYRLSNLDETEVVVIHRLKISISRLAPYSGWDEFRSRIERDWKAFKSVTGYRKIVRIGMRYINRLDLPLVNNKVTESEYLKVGINFPPILQTHGPFALTAICEIPDIKGVVNINSAAIEPAIVGHASFLLDFDLYRQQDLPQKDNEMFDLLETMASKKNDLFESSITDRARALFDARKS